MEFMRYLSYIFTIISITFIRHSRCRNSNFAYETAYACEGKSLKIECAEGERIHLIRANYGRFSITICNDHGDTDWSVNCMSQKSLRVLHSKCSFMQNCTVLASSSMFGDPCVGTRKYLEAHYQCLAAGLTGSTQRANPWLISTTMTPIARGPTTVKIPRLPPIFFSIPPQVTRTTMSTPVISSMPEMPKAIEESLSVLIPQLKNRLKNEMHVEDASESDVQRVTFNTEPIPTTFQPSYSLHFNGTFISTEPPYEDFTHVSSAPSPPYQLNSLCSPIYTRNLHWNWTQLGDHINQPCPGGASGFARWNCISEDDKAQWQPDTPDLSECRSLWLTNLESRVLDDGRLIAISSDLAQVTSSNTLYGGDMMITAKMITNMAQKMANDIQSIPDTRQRETIVTELLNDVARTTSNLLDVSQRPAWMDLSYKEQMHVGTSLLTGLEENAFLLAETIMRDKCVNQTFKNIILSIRVLDTRTIDNEVFPLSNSGKRWNGSDDAVIIPKSTLQENSEGGLVRVVFIAFNRLEEILQWNAHAYEHEPRANITRILNSKIISASLGKGRHIQVSEFIQIHFSHLRTENVSNPACVFWDYTMSAWSEEGCSVEYTNHTHTLCRCTHLTIFAILMDWHEVPLGADQATVLQIIVYVTCIVLLICILLIIVTFHTFKNLKVRKEYRKIVQRHYWLPCCMRCTEIGSPKMHASANGDVGVATATGGGAGVGSVHVDDFHAHIDAATMRKEPHCSLINATLNMKRADSQTQLPASPSGALHSPTAAFHTSNICNNSMQSYNADVSYCTSKHKKCHSPDAYDTESAFHPVVPYQRCKDMTHYHRKPIACQQYVSGQSVISVADDEYAQRDLEHQHHMDHQARLNHAHHLEVDVCTAPGTGRSLHYGGARGGRKKYHNPNIFRTLSPWNHTYTEIHDLRLVRALQCYNSHQSIAHYHGDVLGEYPKPPRVADDPVYEEIDRNEFQVSDMSDEDARRQNSDMSGQSSRSYSDNRPLIQYVEGGGTRGVAHASHVLFRPDNVRSLAAVFDGDTVVCHVESTELSTSDNSTKVLPNYVD